MPCRRLFFQARSCFSLLPQGGEIIQFRDLREKCHYQGKGYYLYYCIVNGNDMLIMNGTIGTVSSLSQKYSHTQTLNWYALNTFTDVFFRYIYIYTCTHTVYDLKSLEADIIMSFLMAVIMIFVGVILVRFFILKTKKGFKTFVLLKYILHFFCFSLWVWKIIGCSLFLKSIFP